MPSPTLSEASFILVNQSTTSGKLVSTIHPSTAKDYIPGTAASYAHDWSDVSTGGLCIRGRHFVDSWGRVCQLRGVNLAGNCKTPVNDDHESFPSSKEVVTFVGRPFPLEEAHEHLARLRRWGLTFIRFLVTWEAIEHEGPGQYDKSYLAYLHDLLSMFPQYAIKVYISMHQDVWSRYSGGSGAPAWTLTSVGLSIFDLQQAHAAWLVGVKGGGHTEAERGLWPTGYQKLASSTMNTVFWAGDVFTPKLKIGGEKGVPAQQFLQDAFLASWEILARTIGHLDAVLGFEMMNEPHRGYVDIPSLHGFDYNTDLHLGPIPSAFQGFVLGSGRPATVPVWTRSFPMPTRQTSYTTLTPSASVWTKDGPTKGKCLWEMHGLWGWDPSKKAAVALRESYFKKNPSTGATMDWYGDFYWPFLKRWVQRIRSVDGCQSKWIFVEPIPNELCPKKWTEEHRFDNMVFAPHWYDLNALFQKAFGRLSVNVQGLSRGMFVPKALYWGHSSARDCYNLQLRNIAEAAYQNLGERPVIFGECGVPMDMNKREAFRTDDWEWQERMMDALVTGLDRCLVGFNLWNYNPTNEDDKGDDWNGENFSWFSNRRAHLTATSSPYSQINSSLDKGGRILHSVVRPYPAKVAGIPVSFSYEPNTGSFSLTWEITPMDAPVSSSQDSVTPSIAKPPLHHLSNLTSRESEIFVPSMLTHGRQLIVQGITDENWRYDESRQTLYILNPAHLDANRLTIEVALDPPLPQRWLLHSHWQDFGIWYATFTALLMAIIGYFWIPS